MNAPDAERGAAAVGAAALVDVDAFRRWLVDHAPELVPAHGTLAVTKFPAGFSNLTFLVEAAEVPDGTGVRAKYVLRRPPLGARTGLAHDMAREYRTLVTLHALGLPVPHALVLCEDEQVIGAPFYIMQHVDGVILRGSAPEMLPNDLAERRAQLHALSVSFVNSLAALHAVDVTVPALSALGNPQGYVERQTRGWTQRWHRARSQEVPDMSAVAAWLEANRPADHAASHVDTHVASHGASLIHNDFKWDNLVLDAGDLTRVVAILDWEMVTVGDPMMDLGTSLAYWVEPSDDPIFSAIGLGMTALAGNASRAELVSMYAAATGRDVSDVLFFYVFGVFKVAVIAQQIHARFTQGMAADPRFARLELVVAALASQARVAITRGTL